MLHDLVKQKLHGTIACESEEGKGVPFRIEMSVRLDIFSKIGPYC